MSVKKTKIEEKYQPIDCYGVIGDLRTVAHVGINGSIDFMCYPTFDSPSIFTKLLDAEKGGHFQIATQKNAKKKQLYLHDTNILTTKFFVKEGIGELIDFMPISSGTIFRKVTAVKGEIPFFLKCAPRFNYARTTHSVKQLDQYTIAFMPKQGDPLFLQGSIPLKIKQKDCTIEFVLKESESAEFSFGNKIIKEISDAEEKAFEETNQFWKNWVKQSTYKGLWRDKVIRSALVLKLLTSDEYGCIVAAPTFSLPEKIGGSKNWDYRFSWIRDSAFTAWVWIQIGFQKEAKAFKNWMETICKETAKNSSLKPVYAINKKFPLKETLLTNLKGYKKSKPVRIGNAANKQLQLDLYGEFFDSIYLFDKDVAGISSEMWNSLRQEIDWLVKNWKDKDCGIWEIRGQPQQFLHSKVMCWTAIDRAIKIGGRHSYPYPASWAKVRDEIYTYIHENFWNEEKQTFVQYLGTDKVDASLLLIPIVHFIDFSDPKWISTLACIERELTVDCHVYRYDPQEAKAFGLKGGEGTFCACSFWYIECLARAGQLEKAQNYFDKILSYSNHLGLFAEQLNLEGDQLGNYPQALTHLSLISAAHHLNKLLNP